MKRIMRAYTKKSILLGYDVLFAFISIPAALFIRLEPENALAMFRAMPQAYYAVAFLSFLFSFIAFRTYRTILRLANLFTAVRITAAVACGVMLEYVLANFILNLTPIPRSAFLIQGLLLVPACLLPRFSFRLFERFFGSSAQGTPTLVYGAGLTTDRLLPMLIKSGEHLRIVGLIDDDPAKRGSDVQGYRVLGDMSNLPKLIRRYGVELVILSMPTIPGTRLREILRHLNKLELKVKVLPTPDFYLSDKAYQRLDLRDLNIEDLLRRSPRNINRSAIEKMIQGRTVLVTGGGGSIGSELVRQIAAMNPAKLIVNDASEFALYKIMDELKEKFPSVCCTSALANIADRRNCNNLFAQYNIDLVFHACAYKHVPLVEDNICTAVLNNIESARNVFEAALATNVKNVVLISSDKAVRPTNVMGATKRVCELLALWYMRQQQHSSPCAFSAVRFGNVLGSSGSVLPRFIEQINTGGPVTITHPDITRFFMLIPEAVSLVLQAATASQSGEIFILNMGEPIRILDMAKDLIELMGKQVDEDIKITFTGLRPGEKLYEELQLESEGVEPVCDDFFKLTAEVRYIPHFMGEIDALLKTAESGDEQAAKRLLFELIQRHEGLALDPEGTMSLKTVRKHSSNTTDISTREPIILHRETLPQQLQ